MYQVIATDLDGTLLNADHQVDPFTVETVNRLEAKGLQFVIATGRHYADVAGIRDVLGIRSYLITSNGARVHAPDDTVIHARDLDAGTVRRIVQPEIVGKHGRVIVSLFADDAWLIDREAPQLLAFHQDSGFTYQVMDLTGHSGEDIARYFMSASRRIWPKSPRASNVNLATPRTSPIRCPIAWKSWQPAYPKGARFRRCWLASPWMHRVVSRSATT